MIRHSGSQQEPAAPSSESPESIFPFPPPSTSANGLPSSLAELKQHTGDLVQATIPQKVRLAESCLQGVFATALEWVEASCAAKGIPADSPCRAEEITLGPMIVARQLRLIIQTLTDIQRYGAPQLPGKPHRGPNGCLRVPIVPVRGLFDSLLFPGFRAFAWMQPGVTQDDLFHDLAAPARDEANLSLVLGAGNVSAISATDTFGKIFQENQVVLLKMHPVNDYLGPIFEKAFRPLIESGYLRIIYGGADVGSAAVAHRLVDNVHITGSVDTHDAIVWGSGEDCVRRRIAGTPLLEKPITSELGNVSPWIIVPGTYSPGQFQFQAENVAASIVNNASFGCCSTRVIITWKEWTERNRFLDAVQQVLSATPPRQAYYPGAAQRFQLFTGLPAECETEGALPWTLLRDCDPDAPSVWFRKESFVCACVEVALGGYSEGEFLERAVEFANERLWGTLSASVTVPPRFRKGSKRAALFEECLQRLRYGSIGINQWPGLMYGLVSPPWGGYPDASLKDAQSGIGWVHNTYALRGSEKTVLEGPLTIFPKPLWFPSHAAPEPLAWAALKLYEESSPWRVPSLLYHALNAQLATQFAT